MAQLRHDYAKFQALKAEVLVMVPNGPKMINRYLGAHEIPYPILSDKGSKVAGQYFQTRHFFAFGTPTVFVVDTSGRIQYTHYASSLIEEPGTEEPLAALAQLAGEG
ncbi:MAG: redoxin domain-containing protein [Anaerolineaceae bacterium]|nr:redoxin domain-containing protein [Anaerolineaceae bacterium]